MAYLFVSFIVYRVVWTASFVKIDSFSRCAWHSPLIDKPSGQHSSAAHDITACSLFLLPPICSEEEYVAMHRLLLEFKAWIQNMEARGPLDKYMIVSIQITFASTSSSMTSARSESCSFIMGVPNRESGTVANSYDMRTYHLHYCRNLSHCFSCQYRV